MQQFVCIKKCYPNRLCKVGDIVGAEVRDLAPLCFIEKTDATEGVGGAADESPKVFSNADIVKAKRNKTIAGEKKSTRKKV